MIESFSPPTRRLREHPALDQLKRQAKELLKSFLAGEAHAVAEVNAFYRSADPARFALHDAQLVLARAYGFDSWPKLKAFVDGVTVHRLAAAVRAADTARVRAMLKLRPELVHMDMAENNEHRALHYAVLERSPGMVRLLMEHGADARKGIYPHREATSALTIATERGYHEIVAIILEEEQRRRARSEGDAATAASAAQELSDAIAEGDDARAIALLEADPALLHACHRPGWTPLHVAAAARNETMTAWLLDHGADVHRRDAEDRTPLDMAARTRMFRAARPQRFAQIAALLRERGAGLTLRSAVALGEADWLRARYAAGELTNPIEDWGGLLTIAVRHERPQILELLLECGLDPDERRRLDGVEELVYSWGMPLWHCARMGDYEMAEMLLRRGADPNGQVYASGSVVYAACVEHQEKLVELLERYGGVVDAATAGHLRLTEKARQLLADQDAGRLRKGSFTNATLEEELLWAGLRGGDPEIVRLALERIDWPRHDERWHGLLWSPLPGYQPRSESDHTLFFQCFRRVLERCDPNVRQSRFGRTVLHDVAASDDVVSPAEALAFATALLDAGAGMNERDAVLQSTPLGWACRWGRSELVKLLLERGADPVEPDAEPWATPRAWAEKMEHHDVAAVLREHGG